MCVCVYLYKYYTSTYTPHTITPPHIFTSLSPATSQQKYSPIHTQSQSVQKKEEKIIQQQQ